VPYVGGETPVPGDYVKNQFEQPGISNNVGPVKSFLFFAQLFLYTSLFTPKSGPPGSLLTSASTTTARS
jgi:hypothetical protein